MTSVSIIRSDNPQGPADEGILRYENQMKRKDPEAMILKEYREIVHQKKANASNEKIITTFCNKLGGITIDQFIHKLEIFYGMIEDDEKEWREKKYGKQ